MSDEARDYIANAAYDPVYGARPLKRYIQQYVETPLAREVIKGDIKDGDDVHIEVKDENLAFEVKK